MSSLIIRLGQAAADAFAAAGYDPKFGAVTVSDRPDLCQFQCNGALQAAKQHGEKPRDVAAKVIVALRESGSASMLAKIDMAGPGFINIDVTDDALAGQIASQSSHARLGVEPVAEPKKIFIDYGGANVAKPMHVGHLRSSIIGDSLKRVGRLLGHDVIGDIHLGDWGLQMGMLIAELKRRQPELPYFDSNATAFPAESPVTIEDLQQLYPEANARAKQDPEAMEAARLATAELQAGRAGYRALWRHFVDVSVRELRADFWSLGVEFDLWLGESDVADHVPALVEKLKAQGAAYLHEGALIVDVAEPGDKRELPPLLLTKSDGAALYSTTDLATLEQRMRDRAEVILYVVDNRQSDHFEQVFRAARKTGIVPPAVILEHIGFGTMNGPDGKPFKTRAGGVMRLKDLMSSVTTKARERMTEAKVAADYSEDEKDEIATDVGLAALKYADLVNYRAKDYVFDLDRFSSFEGKTGPYLLYAVVRVKSIMDNAAARGLVPGRLIAPGSDAERRLMLTLAQFPDVVNLAFAARAPSYLAEYAYALATTFSKFYTDHHILSESDPARQVSWLALVSYTARVLEQALDMLGIHVPRRM